MMQRGNDCLPSIPQSTLARNASAHDPELVPIEVRGTTPGTGDRWAGSSPGLSPGPSPGSRGPGCQAAAGSSGVADWAAPTLPPNRRNRRTTKNPTATGTQTLSTR